MNISVRIIRWIIQQESGKDEIKQNASIVLSEGGYDKRNISNQANINNYDKKDIDTALLDINNLVNLVEKTEVPE
jgi:hypothetical protein